MYKQEERVTWRGLNKHLSGIVTGFYLGYAVVRVDGSGKSILLQNQFQPTLYAPQKDGER